MDEPRLNIGALLEEKTCSACNFSKPKSDFYLDRSRPMSKCKKCISDEGKVARRARGIHHEWTPREHRDGKLKCVVCKDWKLPTDFHKNKNSRFGVRSQCKKCSCASTSDYRKRNIENVRRANREGARRLRKMYPDRLRNTSLKFNYGITLDQYNVLLEVQGGACAICGACEADASGKKLHVDHDHDTGRIRGLLCTNCNHGLGKFKDSPERLTKAIEYLTRTRA